MNTDDIEDHLAQILQEEIDKETILELQRSLGQNQLP
jgi:hypothetical protein